MGLNETPAAERIQIGFFGKTNSGKSSLINAVANQEVSIASDTAGTTADPVSKAMELLPLGAVLLIDTAGYNDNTNLGALRIEKTLKVLSRIDAAVLVIDAEEGLTEDDKEFIKHFKEKNIKYLTVYNKCGKLKSIPAETISDGIIYTDALKKINIEELKEKIAAAFAPKAAEKRIAGDLIKENDIVILVTPIDAAAPKGRIILPQQQVLRDILDSGGICIAAKETQLEAVLKIYSEPKLVITDSQVFNFVNSMLPENILLTSFSILFARYKGILNTAVKGAGAIEALREGDAVLISEGCTHHRQCGDIGTEKLPKLLKKYTKKNFNFDFTSGHDFPENLDKYNLIIHCGGCMLNEREVINRYEKAAALNIPITNYGIAISYMNGILEKSIKVFKSRHN